MGLKKLKQRKIELKDTALGRCQGGGAGEAAGLRRRQEYGLERGALLEHLVTLEEERLVAEMDGKEGNQEDVQQAHF